MRIAIDLDGTCMDFMGHWRGEYRKQFPEFELKPPTNGYHQLHTETHFRNENEWWEWHRQFVGWANLPFLPGAVRVIKRLQKKGHVVEFVTARPSYGWMETRRQIHNTFDNVLLTFSAQYPSKADCIEATVSEEYWPDIWVEDSPAELGPLMAHRMTDVPFYPWNVVIFDQPWNQHIEGRHRITQWTQMNRIVKELQ